MNQRVRATVGSAVTEFVFNAGGQRVSEWNGLTYAQNKGKYYWGGRPVAYYIPGGAVHFEHQDWLGTERMRTPYTYTGSNEGTFTSLPFGDGQSGTGTDGDANHYATLDHDTESDTDHAQFRQYSNTQGHWMSPDPYGGSYDVNNPQSMNRYVYTSNNPLAHVDSSGLVVPPDIYYILLEGGGGGGLGSNWDEFDTYSSSSYYEVDSPNGSVIGVYSEQSWENALDGGNPGITLTDGDTGNIMANDLSSNQEVNTGYSVDEETTSEMVGMAMATSQIPSGNVNARQTSVVIADPIKRLAANIVTASGLYTQTPDQAHAQRCAASLYLLAAGYPFEGVPIAVGRGFWAVGVGTNFVPNWGCASLQMPPP